MTRPMRKLLASASLVVVAWSSSDARAERSSLQPETGYYHGEAEDARVGAMSGAVRATGNGITSVFGNPAGLAMTRVYHVGALASIWPEARRQSYGAAAMDSVTSRLALGVGFMWNDQDPDGLKRRSQDLRIAAAYPFSDNVSFGIAGRYLKLRQNGLGPLGYSYASSGLAGEPVVDGFSFDAGLRVAPNENFSIGAVGTNLSNPGNGFQPTTFGGGIGIGNETLVFGADAVADFTTWQETTSRAMGGVEFLAAGSFPLRLGYLFDGGAESHAVSGGVGYIDTQFSFEFGLRRIVSGDEATTLLFTLQYFVESSGMTRTPAPMGDF